MTRLAFVYKDQIFFTDKILIKTDNTKMEKTEKLSNHRHMHGGPRRFEEKKAID